MDTTTVWGTAAAGAAALMVIIFAGPAGRARFTGGTMFVVIVATLWKADELKNSELAIPLLASGLLCGLLFLVASYEESLRRLSGADALVHRMQHEILEASPLPIIAVDKKGAVEFWNDAAARVFGWSRDEAIGTFLPILPTQALRRLNDSLSHRPPSSLHVGRPIQRLRKDGSRVELLLWTAPYRGQRGDIVGTIGIFEDVTDKLAQERESARRATLQQLRNEMLLSIASSDEVQAGDITGSADAIARTAVGTAELDGASVWCFGPGRSSVRLASRCMRFGEFDDRKFSATLVDYPRFAEFLQRSHRIEEVYGVRSDPRVMELGGRYFERRGISSVLHVPVIRSGEVTGFLWLERGSAGNEWSFEERGFGSALGNLLSLALHASTKRESFEELVRRTEALMDARDRSLVAALERPEGVPEGLRAPLHEMIGMAGLIVDDELSAETPDYARTLRVSADALLSVINDVLDCSRFGEGALSLSEEEFSPMTLCEETVETIAERAYERGMEVAFISELDPFRSSVGDPRRVRQLLLNLLLHAIQRTESGTVVLRARIIREDGDTVTHRFTAFGGTNEPAHGSLGSASDGARGQELEIASRLVELMQGAMGAENGPDGSFGWWAEIPLYLGPRRVVDMGFESMKLRLLIVSPHDAAADGISRTLSSLGISSTFCRSLASAQQLLQSRTERFSGVVLDADVSIVEPEGFNATLRELAFPIIVIASPYRGEGALRWLEQPSLAHVMKPVRFHELCGALQAVFGDGGQPLVAPDVQVISEGLRVLLVEDDLTDHETATALLQELGCLVHIVGDGPEAVDAVDHGDYDLVMMGCLLPSMKGLDTARRIRERGKSADKLKIVAFTGSSDADTVQQCRDAGMDHCLMNPIAADAVRELIDRHKNGEDPDRAPVPCEDSSPI